LLGLGHRRDGHKLLLEMRGRATLAGLARRGLTRQKLIERQFKDVCQAR